MQRILLLYYLMSAVWQVAQRTSETDVCTSLSQVQIHDFYISDDKDVIISDDLTVLISI